jgi:hypothetical protein
VAERNVAVACCRGSVEAGPTDLYPDPDAAPLQSAISELGARSTLLAWDDPAAQWGSFSHVIVSSTWDSVDRPAEYLAWARRVTEQSVLVNPARVIEWCLDKVHQKGLAAEGVPMIPTTWISPEDPFSALPPRELVVKPSISAGGRSTARYTPGDPAAIGHVRKLQQAGQTVMVQEYLARIDEEGEVNLVFLDGSFSHAVAKKPLLHVGDGLVERPWERMAWAGLVEPSANQLAVAHLTMKVAEEQVGCVPVYGRVDLVSGNAGEPLVLEVELIDPYLSFDMQPSAAARLAKALLR